MKSNEVHHTEQRRGRKEARLHHNQDRTKLISVVSAIYVICMENEMFMLRHHLPHGMC